MMGKYLLAVLLSTCILVIPCRADVIGSKAPSREKNAAEGVVAKRLTDLGIHQENARQQVSSLTDRDLAFFSQKPGRIRLAGAQEGAGASQDFFGGSSTTLWYEIVLGAIVLVAAGVTVWIAFTGN